MRWILGFCGVVASTFFLAVSGVMNWRFGYMLGHTELDAQLFAAMSASADALKALIPFFGYVAWRQRMYLPGLVCVSIWLVCTAYSFASGFGFGAANRAYTASKNQNTIAVQADLRADRNRLLEKLDRLPKHRPAPAVAAEIEAAKQHSRWLSSANCSNATASKSRDFCQSYNALTAEHAVAVEAGTIEAQLTEIDARLRAAGSQTAARSDDPQVSELSRLFGFEKANINTALVLLVAVLGELGSGLGFFITFAYFKAAGLEKRAEKAETQRLKARQKQEEALLAELQPKKELIEHTPFTAPQILIEAFIDDRLVPAPNSDIVANELYADFCAWCELRGAPGMTAARFGREVSEKLNKAKIGGRIRYFDVKFKGAALALLEGSESAKLIEHVA